MRKLFPVLAVIFLLSGCGHRVAVSRAVLWGGLAADFVTTRVAIQQGTRELNPLAGQSPRRQAALLAANGFFAELLAAHDSPRARFLTGSVHIGFATWNTIQIIR